jgi:hypothetical protein
MKKILTFALTFCAFIAAMACGSNDPEVDGMTRATEQTGGDEGTAKESRLHENAEASEVMLTEEEFTALDCALRNTPMSEVFRGSKIVK